MEIPLSRIGLRACFYEGPFVPVHLITGCSSGFGEGIALAFARRGDTVIATMRNPDSAPARPMCWTISPVTDAVIAAATDPEPKARHLAGVGLALEIEGSMAELERLHTFSAQRCGIE